MPRRKHRNTEAQVDAFMRYQPGDSFFVEGASSSDLKPLLRAFRASGIGFTVRQVARDPIYQTRGTRVWRRPGECDEL
jgi:hypothetical protein